MSSASRRRDPFPLRNRVAILPYIMLVTSWDLESGHLAGRVATSDPGIICEIEGKLVGSGVRAYTSVVSASGAGIRFQHDLGPVDGVDASSASGKVLFAALACVAAKALGVVEFLAHRVVEEGRDLTEDELREAREWSIEDALEKRIAYLLMWQW